MDIIKKKLNPEQFFAVCHGRGPALIVAGAGTGKTTVLIERLRHLLDNKLAKLDEILILTFTDKGAQELEGRALEALPYGYLDLWISTFHGFGERLVRQHALDIGLNPDFKLLTQTEQWILIKKNLERFSLDYYQPLGNPNKFIYELTRHFSRLKDENIQPAEYLDYADGLEQNRGGMLGAHDSGLAMKITKKQETTTKKTPKTKHQAPYNIEAEEIKRLRELANAYHVYNQLLIERGDFDFGDLINYALKLFRERPNILSFYQKKFKYIMVDEFQDTNWAQYELIKLLAGENPNLMVVGDDDQAIYKFRGASLSNIMQFKDDFPLAKEMVLVRNYRSGQRILDSAYELIKNNNPNRLEEKLKINKALISEAAGQGEVIVRQFPGSSDEESFIVDTILGHVGEGAASYSDFAILIRANSQADAYIAELNAKNIPNTFVSMKGLYYKPLIMDLIAYLNLLDDYHESAALFRVLNMPPFAIGHADIISLNRFARRKNWSLFEALKNAQAVTDLAEETQKKIQIFLSWLGKHSAQAAELGIARLFISIINDLGIHSNKDYDRNKEFFSLLNQFYLKLKKFEQNEPGAKLKDFMALLDLELEAGETGSLKLDYEDADTVKIMTVHAAKGLEFRYVFLPQLVDKKFPTVNRGEKISLPDQLVKEVLPAGKQVHLEEERRLFYVALTRAKEKLFLTGAKDYGGATEKKMSVFLKEAALSVIEIGGGGSDNQLFRDLARLNAPAPRRDEEYGLPKEFSFSQIEAYNNCPLQYKFNFILKIPVEAKAVFAFGRVIHNTLNDFLSPLEKGAISQPGLFGADDMIKKKPDFSALKKSFDKYWQEEGYQSAKEKADYKKLGREMLKNFFDDLEKNGWPEILFLEKRFTAKIKDYPFKGAIDRIDIMPDGRLAVVDYKTGEAPKDFYYQTKKQLLLYKIALEEVTGHQVGLLAFHYLRSGEKKSFEATENDLEKFKTETIATIEKICSKDFPPKPGMLCQFCDFNRICEYRQG